MATEVTHRAAFMSADTQYLTNKLYQLKHIKTRHKITVAQTYMLTRGTFQCCTWDPLSVAVFKRFHGAIMKVYRSATNTKYNPNNVKQHSDIDIILDHKLCAPIVMLHNSRLQLLCRICKKAPDYLIYLIKEALSMKPSSNQFENIP